MLGRMKLQLESRLPGEISITSDMHMTPPNARKERKEELKNLLMQVKEENEKAGLKLNTPEKKKKAQHSKTKNMASGPITSW